MANRLHRTFPRGESALALINPLMAAVALHPGIKVEEVRQNTGWELKTAADLQITQPPTMEELTILREQLDPDGIYLK
jgi:glutaconate CoA-transferase subunit B